jgi:hypothetical protein
MTKKEINVLYKEVEKFKSEEGDSPEQDEEKELQLISWAENFAKSRNFQEIADFLTEEAWMMGQKYKSFKWKHLYICISCAYWILIRSDRKWGVKNNG